jgi:hypothetical protein
MQWLRDSFELPPRFYLELFYMPSIEAGARRYTYPERAMAVQRGTTNHAETQPQWLPKNR